MLHKIEIYANEGTFLSANRNYFRLLEEYIWILYGTSETKSCIRVFFYSSLFFLRTAAAVNFFSCTAPLILNFCRMHYSTFYQILRKTMGFLHKKEFQDYRILQLKVGPELCLLMSFCSREMRWLMEKMNFWIFSFHVCF